MRAVLTIGWIALAIFTIFFVHSATPLCYLLVFILIVWAFVGGWIYGDAS